jgi:hypothetical protein
MKTYFDGYLKAENFNKTDCLNRENLVSKLNEFFIKSGSEQRIYEKIKNKHRSRFIRKMIIKK